MFFVINNIRLDIEDNIDSLKDKAAKELKVSINDIKEFNIIKESIDARRKGKIDFIYSVKIKLYNNSKIILNDNIKCMEEQKEEVFEYGNQKMKKRPVIIGTGPAGLFAALILSYEGYNPIVLERGADVDTRTNKVNEFWKNSKLDINTNVQFGEGGAGTFSDGKLTTRINDKRCEQVLKQFVKFGAPNEILYKGKPHIGTDLLKNIIKNMRNEMISQGADIRFLSKVTDFKFDNNNNLKFIEINDKEELETNIAVLAIGHSARDTYEVLAKNEIKMEQKAFSIGVRIEHPQSLIDYSQYKEFAKHPKLKAADYKLVYKTPDRACYSFCMCPGGTVVASASEYNSIVTNGMSEFKRDKENANSALVVSIGPKDFNSDSPLAGIEFQRKWERLAFEKAGSNYSAPVQLVGDFLNSKISKKIGKVNPSYTGNISFTNLYDCLPNYVISTLSDGLRYFDKKIHGYAMDDAIMTGVETRTSAPLRIVRNDNLESINHKGLYPCGEGAGYAGGIISAAVDGIRIAEKIMSQYSPL